MAAAGCTLELKKAITSQSHWHRFQATLSLVWHKMQSSAARIGIGKATEPKLESLDDLLIEALKNENPQTVGVLLKLGASANAKDLDHLGRSALGYATSANDLEAMQLLFVAGANPNLRLENEKKQIVTPLTQALRSDPAKAIELLLQKGATLATDDPHGWTPMHIAAYESAHQSIAVMARLGGNVNEITPTYRQQTAFHTAVQFANVQTIKTMLSLGADLNITDNQRQNACGWAKFFKRNEEIQSLVCVSVLTPSVAPTISK